MAYGYKRYQKLVLKFSDKIRESNVFETTRALNDSYIVYVEENGLLVKNTTPVIPKYAIDDFLLSLAITIFAESFIAFLFRLKYKFIPNVFLLYVAGVNLITVPFIWYGLGPVIGFFGLSGVLADYGIHLLLLLVLFEAFLLYMALGRKLEFKYPLLVSIVANFASYFFGGLWLMVLSPILGILFS